MATALDLQIGPAVLAVIARVGKVVTWTVKSGGTKNPTAGTVDGVTTTNYTVKCSPPSAYEQRYVDGKLIQQGDAKLILAGQGLAFTPALGQSVTIDGVVWRVLGVDPIYSGELIAAWKVQVRR